MRPTFRKVEVKEISHLERLVVENADGVEAGMMIVDSRLLLGQTSIDLVGLDGKGSLVLIALDFTADDALLLRVMDAYAWCVEYPDTLRRLYPMAKASSRPPRILFIVEKTTDAFLRRIKQLSLLEIDCFEFRHLEVNGSPVVYFDLVERLRKSIVETKVEGPAPAPAGPAKTVEARVKPRTAPRIEPVKAPVEVKPAIDVKPPVEWSTLVESRAPVREPKRVDPPRAVPVEPVRVEPAAVVAAALQSAAPIAAAPSMAAPVAEEPRTVAEVQTPPVVEFQMVKLEAAAVPSTPEPSAVIPAEPAVVLESIESTSRPYTNGYLPEPAVASLVEAAPSVPAPVEAPMAASPVAIPFESSPAPAEPEAAVPGPVPPSPVWAKSGAQPNGARPQFFTTATKSNMPVETPATVAEVAPTAEPATQPAASKAGLEVDDRPELESLSFPKDGLSRQWLEFLSQLGATK